MFSAPSLRPMLATLPDVDPPLADPKLVYEPKYDGIRAIVLVEPEEPKPRVRFWSRLGNEKTTQFPELVAALGDWGSPLEGPVVLDGEIVALDAKGRPAGFQRLQSRIHVTVPGYRSSKPILRPDEQPTAFIAFDLLRDDDVDLRAAAAHRAARAARAAVRDAQAAVDRAFGSASRSRATAATLLRARARPKDGRACSSSTRDRSIATAAAAPSGSS